MLLFKCLGIRHLCPLIARLGHHLHAKTKDSVLLASRWRRVNMVRIAQLSALCRNKLTPLSRGQRLLLRPQQGRPGVLCRGLCLVWRLAYLPLHVSVTGPRLPSYLPALSLILHSQYKSWRLTGLYVFCAVLFTAGFIVRVLGAFDYKHLIKYIISTCLIYAAPCVPRPPSLPSYQPPPSVSANPHAAPSSN